MNVWVAIGPNLHSLSTIAVEPYLPSSRVGGQRGGGGFEVIVDRKIGGQLIGGWLIEDRLIERPAASLSSADSATRQRLRNDKDFSMPFKSDCCYLSDGF
jgi:hypothetical protein